MLEKWYSSGLFVHGDIAGSTMCQVSPSMAGPFKIIDVLHLATVKVQLPVVCRAHPVFDVVVVRNFVENTSLRGTREKTP